MKVITNKQQYNALSDTKLLAKQLAIIAAKPRGEPMSASDAYYIMESRVNLLALYKLCSELLAVKQVTL